MTLKERILDDLRDAFKSKDREKKMVLSTLIGELDRDKSTKNPSDEIVMRVIKKMIDNNILTNTENENEHLSIYLPENLSDEELEKVIGFIVSDLNATSMRDMGKVMGRLSQDYSGQYDGQKASVIVKNLLT